MINKVKVRKSGNSLVLTVPTQVGVTEGEEYKASKLADGTIIYEPTNHTNIFATKEAQDYDFQADVQNDPELQPVDPVGLERLDD
ncbi:hypothetical protein YK48G_10060 [Lentilactobacillus fungorum]|uniref:AbrB family transcriptional regulator n=1 Tax=Lentilactobacillus fungorum TaxID=2201250 RepID=A0ABQ3VYR3_9LACO|nr:hypothetical protein [Lentilactobacillus fungorum]GHP13581.1 hypothetical protein YK48G_10060 [Lentilactobacillus fungorum]